MRMTSVPVMVIFFENGILSLITARFRVPPQQIRGTLPIAFGKVPYSSLFYEHGSTCALNFSSRLKRYWNEYWWRCLEKGSYTKCALERTLYQNRNHVLLNLCAPLSFTNLVFKFNTVLIGFFFFFLFFLSVTIYLFAFWLTFDLSLVLKFIQFLYAFYKE